MPHLSLPEASIPNSIDLKANGEVSRMRSHKGNMPSLPQTKYCPLCPAKFTRTTHLNRHLRSHTNERAHRCNICNAEFTRSDLLTRHKRTCGDSSVNRSRRKSCQACAESKVKCNLQHPCTKCTSRGRECVFINDPEASRNKKSALKKSSRMSPSTSPSETEYSESSTGFESLSPCSPASPISFGSHGPDAFSHLYSPPLLSSHHLPATGYGMPGVSTASDSSSSACSSRSSPQLDFFDMRHDFTNTLSMDFDTMELDAELNNYFPSALDPYLEEQFSPCLPRVQTEMDLAAWFDQPSAGYGNEPSIFSQCQQPPTNQDFISGLASLTPACSSKVPFSRPQFSTISPVALNGPQFAGASSGSGDPTPEELNLYLYLFFSEFSTQIPLFHRPTWKMDTTHPILLRAMQACGALFAKTQPAMDFIMKTLSTSRDTLIMEFSKSTCTLKDHMCLMLAVVLLQSIGLLSPRPEQRPMSKAYHEILVMMIRKTSLIKFIGSWPPPDLSNPQALDSAWKDWARQETFKRALLVAYLQDCSYCVYYSTQPAFHPSEFEINLPCDDTLWRAQSAREWYQIQRTPSPYGVGASRLLGVSMQMALAALRDPSPSVLPYTLNPFASFILINNILRDVFSLAPHPSTNPGGMQTSSSLMVSGGLSAASPVGIQCALHNWQRLWTSSPEAAQSEKQGHRASFVCTPTPHYWLARFAEGAKQNGSMDINPLTGRGEVEDRYRTIKGWLGQINATLHSGSQVSPNLYGSPTAVGMPAFSSHGS